MARNEFSIKQLTRGGIIDINIKGNEVDTCMMLATAAMIDDAARATILTAATIILSNKKDGGEQLNGFIQDVKECPIKFPII